MPRPTSAAVWKNNGGVLVKESPKLMFATGDQSEDEQGMWNFGVQPPGVNMIKMFRTKPSFYAVAPQAEGKWDGQSTINHYLAVEQVAKDQGFNPEELIQQQPRGTCGGRAGSATADFVQCIMIALKAQKAKFQRVSHAGVYYAARKLYNMLEGNWQDEETDGVASGAVPEAMSKIGVVLRDDISDTVDEGPSSDDLACQLGAGQKKDVATKILSLAKNHIIKDWAPVNSAQELADGIASGGIGIGSDMQGFTMTRDSKGFCRPSGQWAHYQVRMSIGVYDGFKAFGYWQSWGPNTPSGPKLAGHPGNCFGVEFSVQDRIIKSGDWAVVWGIPLWELQDDSKDVPWIF